MLNTMERTEPTYPPSYTSPEYDMDTSVMKGWVQTFTGLRVYPLKPEPHMIDLLDIAHALALKCRFTGHCKRFYSVAQHSVYASLLVPPDYARAALLHDAGEYLLPDVAAPIKDQFPDLKAYEHRLMEVICERFAIVWPWPKDMRDAIKHADNQLVVTERRDLMLDTRLPWDVPAAPLEWIIHPWSWQSANVAFLERAAEVGLA